MPIGGADWKAGSRAVHLPCDWDQAHPPVAAIVCLPSARLLSRCVNQPAVQRHPNSDRVPIFAARDERYPKKVVYSSEHLFKILKKTGAGISIPGFHFGYEFFGLGNLLFL